MALPASGYLGDPARTTGEFQTAIEELRDEVALSASTTVTGRVELATDAETQTGTDAARAVTPASLRACTSTETRIGVVELATNAEVQTGTDTARAVTPAGLRACTATDTRIGVVELATDSETITGTDTARAVTPAGLSAAMRPTTATAHARAGRTQIYNGTPAMPNGTDYINLTTSASEAAWVSVGPTGSGATVIWDALDNLPSTARMLIVNMDMELVSDHATNMQVLAAYGAAGGVTGLTGYTSNVGRIGYLVVDNVPIGQRINTFAQQFIPLNSSRVFQFAWTASASDFEILMYYKGFITD